jgi:hypothetical protein
VNRALESRRNSSEPEHLTLVRPGERHLSYAEEGTSRKIDRLAAVDDGGNDVRREKPQACKPDQMAALGSSWLTFTDE